MVGQRCPEVTASARIVAGFDLRYVRGEIVDREVDVPRQHRRNGLRRALERNVHRIDAGARFEQHAGQVRRGAGTGAADRDSVRPRLRPCDELGNRRCRTVLRRDHCDVGQFVGQRRRDQIPFGVVRHVGDQILVDRKVSDRCAADRVAVRRALHDLVDADVARRARPVLDRERLAELVLELFRQDAEQHVGRAAGGIRHDHAHAAFRPVALPEGWRCGERGAGGSGAEQGAAGEHGHRVLPVLCGKPNKSFAAEPSARRSPCGFIAAG